ncbi:uncharacterized protein KY384_003515 [Bacidia gigantensis]|uniref:uncharacterized protein n=1 Tax=Bacidia gigantensis TaxID=2732470 RepID=UPI001D05384E|nr:uncharacterized protein KY384_003515 [Bacidia gigantensis]KAG8531879.1 hypothetical protein KY384_003515 [Bacidia gigantensis]
MSIGTSKPEARTSGKLQNSTAGAGQLFMPRIEPDNLVEVFNSDRTTEQRLSNLRNEQASAVAAKDEVQEASQFSRRDPKLDRNPEFHPYHSDIIRLYPMNESAIVAFHFLLESHDKGELCQHHASYVVKTGTTNVKLSNDVRRLRNFRGKQNENIKTGYYRILFDSPNVLAKPAWVLGPGNNDVQDEARGVDMLLAAPSLPMDPHPLQAILGIHPKSGAWMIEGDSFTKCDFTTLRKGKLQALDRPRIRLQLDHMQYCLEFQIANTTDEQTYMRTRNQIFNHEQPPPRTRISGIPFLSDIHLERAIFRNHVGEGYRDRQTWFEGYDPRSGCPRLIKKWAISKESQSEVTERIETIQNLSKTCRVFQSGNSYIGQGGSDIRGAETPFDCYVVLEKGVLLADYRWSDSGSQLTTARKSVIYQLLIGLAKMHALGIHHRAILPSTIQLLFSRSKPSRAVFFDLDSISTKSDGHSIQEPQLVEQYPAEVPDEGTIVYTEKMDIYMLALTLAQSWYPSYFVDKHTRNNGHHVMIILSLTTSQDPLCHLLARMLALVPDSRPSASEALQDGALSPGQVEEGGRKRGAVSSEMNDQVDKRQRKTVVILDSQ